MNFYTQKCLVCDCTNDDCRQCIQKTGAPCFWVTDNLCSACNGQMGIPAKVEVPFTDASGKDQLLTFETKLLRGHEQKQVEHLVEAQLLAAGWTDVAIKYMRYDYLPGTEFAQAFSNLSRYIGLFSSSLFNSHRHLLERKAEMDTAKHTLAVVLNDASAAQAFCDQAFKEAIQQRELNSDYMLLKIRKKVTQTLTSNIRIELIDGKDLLFTDAARAVVAHQQCSLSFVAIHLEVTAVRAAIILAELEVAKIISAPDPLGRQLLFTDMPALEQHLRYLNEKA
ncbi:MAG: hypothetical protein V4581_16730 [Bacteroidota bacterium]